ncbi:MAG: VIT and vWA domain-containing protein [Phycisphaerales bacterium]
MPRFKNVVWVPLLSVVAVALTTIAGCSSSGSLAARSEDREAVRGLVVAEPGLGRAAGSKAPGTPPAASAPTQYYSAGSPPPGNAKPSAKAEPTSPSVLASLISSRPDEVWIIQRSSRPGTVTVQSRGTGTIVVVNSNEPVDSWPKWERLPTVATDVHAEITGLLAAVKVEQSFTNPSDHPIEAAYAFPLPDDAAVSDFVMKIGDRQIRGIVREREEAKQIYDATKAQGMNAALLEQERPNIFLQRVANIAAGATIGVEITYYNTLPCVDGWCELVLPTTIGPRYTPAGQTPPAAAKQIGLSPRVSIGVDIDAGVHLGKVESPSHTVDVVRPSDAQAFARLTPERSRSDRDFVLRWNIAGEQTAGVVYATSDVRGGYFAMQLVPPSVGRKFDPRPLDLVFVLDRSGSMKGWPLKIAQDTIIRGIDSLKSGERFQIIDFSETASGLGSKMLPSTRENRSVAKRYLESTPAQGGTEMKSGLAAALAIPEEPGRRKVIAFLTDGFIGNEGEVLAMVHKGLGDARIFSFGIGAQPNRFLINELAALGGGVSAWALRSGESAPAMEDFLETVRRPALTDIRVSFGGEDAKLMDATIPTELYPGRAAFITGRFNGPMSGSVVVTARANGRPVSFEVPVKPVRANAAAILPKLWARGQITSLARRELRGEQVDAIGASRNLAIEYGLASQFTSFVAVDTTGNK